MWRLASTSGFTGCQQAGTGPVRPLRAQGSSRRAWGYRCVRRNAGARTGIEIRLAGLGSQSITTMLSPRGERRGSTMTRSSTTRRYAAVAVTFVMAALAGSPAGRAQVPAFKPVTDAMLLNPDPGDWINWRRTLDGWGFSPLKQINKDNVDQLQLVWAKTLGGGLNEPTPLVYNGVMYVPSALGLVQALDAVTGELLWDYTKAITSPTNFRGWAPRMR